MARYRDIRQRPRIAALPASAGLAQCADRRGAGAYARQDGGIRRFLAQQNGGANVSNAQAAKLYGDFLRWRDGQK